MALFIDLVSQGKSLGRHALPSTVCGENGFEFRLIKAVGGGGNGVVFRAATQGSLADEIDHCAVKFLRQQDVARRDRFLNEARILGLLDHARISQFFDTGTLVLSDSVSVPWIAMELGERNLREWKQSGGSVTNSHLVAVALEMCEAISHLHERGILHRDLKPDNFVWDGEDNHSVKMIDFGIAKLYGEDVSARPLDQFTRQMEFVGPVLFSSPELIAYASDKSRPVDHRSDLFQFGKTIWFLATGQISAGIPSERLCPFDGRLHRTVMDLLHDDPRDRPNNIAQVASALQALHA